MKEAPEARLIRLCASDLLSAFKLPRVLYPIALAPARRFAANLNSFDQLVGTTGIVAGGAFLLDLYSGGATFFGREHLQATGPMVVAANHPGMCDAMALWKGIAREDLKVMAAERELLKLLPNASSRLIIVKRGSSESLRSASDHLSKGGALLTFPAGGIEPDPALRTGLSDSLKTWSASLELLVKRTPSTVLIPALVSGAISATAIKSPLIRFIKDSSERDWAGATLQILARRMRQNQLRVAFGAPTKGELTEIQAAMLDLLNSSPNLLR